MFNKKFKIGFTLAEVLITLGIIGIVAAMTIPVLMQNQKERATVTRLKKNYAVLSQAFSMAIKDDGAVSGWVYTELTSALRGKEVVEKLASYLKVDPTLTISGSQYVAQLHDGTKFTAFVNYPSCTATQGSSVTLKNVCGEFWIITPSKNGTNKAGINSFYFWITKYGLVPEGTANATGSYTFANSCNDFYNLDQASSSTGRGCAAWVLYNENMDYLKCGTLSWGGNTTCD